METLPDAGLYPHLLRLDDDDLRESMAAYLSHHGDVERTVDGAGAATRLAEMDQR